MKLFIPSWFEANSWQRKTLNWYSGEKKSLFVDEFSYQIGLHKNNKENVILVLSYFPHLRYFLNDQQLLGMPYWSVFDVIQGTENITQRSLSLETFSWPKDAYVFYTPFTMIVLVNEEIYAVVQITENGNVSAIDYFTDGTVSRSDIYDDRGFLSSQIYLLNGQHMYQDYLSAEGVWVIRENYDKSDEAVTVNPTFKSRFRQSNYSDIQSVIEEKLKQHLKDQDYNMDEWVVSAHTNNIEMLTKIELNHTYTVSVDTTFLDSLVHYSQEERKKYKYWLQNASRITVNQEVNELRLRDQLGENAQLIQRIYPIDSAITRGRSDEIKEIILAIVIGNDKGKFQKILDDYVDPLLKSNEAIRIAFIALEPLNFLNDPLIVQQLESYEPVEEESEIKIDDKVIEIPMIEVHIIRNRSDFMQLLKYARLLIDVLGRFSNELALVAVQIGIPFIANNLTSFIQHGVNGWLIKDTDSLLKGVHYFLDGRINWNQSLAHNVQWLKDLDEPINTLNDNKRIKGAGNDG